MKALILLFFVLCSAGYAQHDLITIAYNGRYEYYWVLYRSADGRHTKITNYHSAISFYVDTNFLNRITVSTPSTLQSAPFQYRVIRRTLR